MVLNLLLILCCLQTQGDEVFWNVFIVLYIICILMLTILVYYVGRWRLCKLLLLSFCFSVKSCHNAAIIF